MKKIIFMISCILVFSSCENKKKKTLEENKAVRDSSSQIEENTIVTAVDDNKTENWLIDFNDFRMAVYHQNKAKLKTYFNFPISSEDSGIWYLIRFSNSETSEGDQALITGDWFKEKDFDRYYQRIFDQKFLKAILKVKSAELLKNGVTETKEFADPAAPFIMHASFNKELNTLQLDMAFRNNGTDEHGVYVSEGEHNLIYIFDIIEGKKLKFKKIVIAG